jgi:hypothetical protein
MLKDKKENRLSSNPLLRVSMFSKILCEAFRGKEMNLATFS